MFFFSGGTRGVLLARGVRFLTDTILQKIQQPRGHCFRSDFTGVSGIQRAATVRGHRTTELTGTKRSLNRKKGHDFAGAQHSTEGHHHDRDKVYTRATWPDTDAHIRRKISVLLVLLVESSAGWLADCLPAEALSRSRGKARKFWRESSNNNNLSGK